MENFYGTEENTYLIATFIVIIGFFIIFAFYVNVVMPFVEERNYIKKEIKRSAGHEKQYWKHMLRDVYISRIPIIGRIILKYSKKH